VKIVEGYGNFQVELVVRKLKKADMLWARDEDIRW